MELKLISDSEIAEAATLHQHFALLFVHNKGHMKHQGRESLAISQYNCVFWVSDLIENRLSIQNECWFKLDYYLINALNFFYDTKGSS